MPRHNARFTAWSPRMRVTLPACLPLACLATLLATLLAACSGNVRDPAPTGSAAHPVPMIEVPDVARPPRQTAAWWYRSGPAPAAGHGAMQGRATYVKVFIGDGTSTP